MLNELFIQLYDIGAIKFGSFKLKSGLTSPFYIDLRETISFPKLLIEISEAIWAKISHLHFERLCGVPYTALPFATYLSVTYNKPMIMRRKEQKEHGTKKIIEGVFAQNHTCLVIEDLISSGISILETIAPIEEAGMQVRDVAVFLDREQGGRQKLQAKGYQLHSVATLSQLVEILHAQGRLDAKTKELIENFKNASH
jgi:orotate phosphoribosyltransferase